MISHNLTLRQQKRMLQFITNTESSVSPVEQVKGVIAGGCRWVQVRMKDASDEEVSRVIAEIKPLCLETETFLILDDRVELAQTLDVGGVHLGHLDMPPLKARNILGPAAVIGYTANKIEDVMSVKNVDIDYIGIGPYRQTTTKKNLAPILGAEGIGAICREMDRMELEFGRVAVGGIEMDDIPVLINSGVHGIAVSGALANAKDISKATSEMLALLQSSK